MSDPDDTKQQPGQKHDTTMQTNCITQNGHLRLVSNPTEPHIKIPKFTEKNKHLQPGSNNTFALYSSFQRS